MTIDTLLTAPKSEIDIFVNGLLGTPDQQFNSTFTLWSRTFKSFWKNPKFTPEQLFSKLGTNAAALVDGSNKTITYLESLKPGCTTSVTELAKPFTVHPDGTVTVN